ncbi:MAG: hypothetical protein U9Q71_09360 [Pseudomonadota bacterium]|nr:hypothetical protein [Pseudomonadota bacterium]
MKQTQYRSLVLGAALTTLLGASGSAYAFGERACKNSVAETFYDAVMADISVSRSVPMKHGEARIDWSVQSEGTLARGFCKVNAGGDVVRLKTLSHKRYEKSGGDEQDGFYYDEHIGTWRDPSGETCHSCTPENGFPNHSARERGSHQKQSRQERERENAGIGDSCTSWDYDHNRLCPPGYINHDCHGDCGPAR